LFGGGDLNFSRIVPGTIRWALHGHPPVIRSDGKPIRDYFYVEDAVSGYLALAENLEAKGLAGEAFNLGADDPMSVLDLVNRILKHVGREDLTPKVMDEANNEIEAQYLDCTKAKDVLGFAPEHGIDEGLIRTISWYRDWLGTGP
jgi:CDP-glucose 4,6-dehydratase